MNVDDRMGSCRDKGRGGVDEGAWCLSWLGCDLFAPRSPHWIALPPGQAPGPHPAPHPPLVPTGPHSVVNIHRSWSLFVAREDTVRLRAGLRFSMLQTERP